MEITRCNKINCSSARYFIARAPIAYGQPVVDKPDCRKIPQEFSLGAIKPAGWLEEMLVRQKRNRPAT